MCKNRDVSRSICYLHDGITEKISTKSPKTSGDFEHRSHWSSRSWRRLRGGRKAKWNVGGFLAFEGSSILTQWSRPKKLAGNHERMLLMLTRRYNLSRLMTKGMSMKSCSSLPSLQKTEGVLFQTLTVQMHARTSSTSTAPPPPYKPSK